MLSHSIRALACSAIVVLGIAGCGAARQAAVSPPPAPIASPQVSSPSPAAISPVTTPPAAALATDSLWSQIRQGSGYVILFRHATAPGTGDPPNFRLDDCATQRNLSEAGRQQAVRMGDQLKAENITVSQVLSSQWCRCLETAKLMNVGPVAPTPALNSFFQDRSTEESQTEQLQQLILAHRDRPSVIVMVTHQVNITAISNIVPASGAAIVMRSSSPTEIELIGQLDPL